MDDRAPLLFLAHLVPWPPDAGASIRSWHLLKELAEGYRVEGVFLRRSGIPLHPEAPEQLARHCAPNILSVGTGKGAAVLRSYLSGRPYTHYLNESAAAGERIRKLIASGGHALVHVDSLDLIAYLPLLTDPGSADPPRIVLGHHSIESEMLERRAAQAPRVWSRIVMTRQARLVRAAEREWSARVELNVCVSDRDADELRSRSPRSRTTVAPNGVDVEYFRPGPASGDDIVFIGGMDWSPNLDAVRFYAEEIQPKFAEPSAATLTCIGRTAGPSRLPDGVRWTGHVPDIRPHVARAAVVVVPLLAGGGTRLKILTAWAMGKPVVSTRLGAEGLEIRPGENILLADSPSEFAAAVTRVRSDRAFAERLGRGGRETAVRQYDWRAVGRRLRGDYDALMRTLPRPARHP